MSSRTSLATFIEGTVLLSVKALSAFSYEPSIGGLDHELLGVQLLHHKTLLEQRNVVTADDLGAVLANVGRQLDHGVVGHVGDSALVLANDQEALLGIVLQSDGQGSAIQSPWLPA